MPSRHAIWMTVFFLFSFILCPVISIAGESLSILIHPYIPATEIMKKFTPLADYLGSKTGENFKIRISRDYQDHINEAGRAY